MSQETEPTPEPTVQEDASAEASTSMATTQEEAATQSVESGAEVIAEEDPVSTDHTDGVAEDSDAEAANDGADEDDEEARDGESSPRRTRREEMDEETEIAADYLEELLDIADLDGDIDTFVEAGRPRVSVVTQSDKLVGKDGEVLEALQELARLAVMTEMGHRSRLMLDIAGFRDKRRKELENMGHDAIAEVKESGESVRLTAMNPFERKVIHDVVAAAGLVSESEGQEPQRRVVVRPS